jgi:protein required for attachment to host cells
MQTNWLVVADEGVARIYQWTSADGHLEEVETLTHASAHAKEEKLRRDAHGRRSGHAARQMSSVTASAGLDGSHGEATLFANRLADWLCQARRASRFDRLRVAAAPRFLGLLRQALDPEVARAIVEDLPKDLVNESRTDLEKRFLSPATARGPVARSPTPGTAL